jgi:integrase/recombinase XerD
MTALSSEVIIASADLSRVSDDHVTKRRGRPSKAEQRERRGRSMGRYPLKAAVERYLERRKLKVGKNTLDVEARALRLIANVLEEMREQGVIKTTGPTLMGESEIKAFLDWMDDPNEHKGKPLDPDTKVRYMMRLEQLLKANGNKIVQRMKDEGYQFPQKAGPKPIRFIAELDLATIQEAAAKIGSAQGEPEGWRRAKARFLMAAYVATGLRPSELRQAHFEDLDVRKWVIHVRHPKGQGKYARNRDAKVLTRYHDEFLAFLQEREELLRYHGRQEATYLIPYLQNGRDTHYSANHFKKLKKEVQELCGVEFRLKDFRPTLATLTVERDPNLLPDVSTQLGHSSILTTQRYYAQISAESAGSRIDRAWESKTQTENTLNSVEEKTQMPSVFSDLLTALLANLGVSSVEELKARLPPKAPCTETPGIEQKNQLAGYN